MACKADVCTYSTAEYPSCLGCRQAQLQIQPACVASSRAFEIHSEEDSCFPAMMQRESALALPCVMHSQGCDILG